MAFRLFGRKKKKPKPRKRRKKLKPKKKKSKVKRKVRKIKRRLKKPKKILKKLKIKSLINKMPDEKAYELLKRYRIKMPPHAFCKNEEELIKSLKKIGFPCVMKVSGKNIIHKTDIGGIRLNIETEEDAIKTFKELMKIKACEKVLVQKMITEGYEIIVGGRKDPQFDRVIALGAGGIFTEFLRDVSFRVPPLSREDAEEMLMEVRFSDLILKGFRGQKPANKEAIVNTILTISRIMEKNPKIREIDINPLFATSKNAIAADIRIILE
ncbi:MAG: acetyl-CoA synthetase [Candidatus Aenigmarchaeota archaeon]|nr:acetyl-CoA synthetase [Candidatus Aenigmarchaeota archaeon]